MIPPEPASSPSGARARLTARLAILLAACTCAIAASSEAGVHPAVPTGDPCDPGASHAGDIRISPTATVVGIEVSPGDGSVPTAAAIETIEPGAPGPRVEVRFTGGGMAWLEKTRADLGEGHAAAIRRVGGDDPAWIVAFARRSEEGVRPVAVVVRPDPEARILDLASQTGGLSDHVFSPRVVGSQGRGWLVWGESRGAGDRIRAIRVPAHPGDEARTVAEGRIGDTIAACADASDLIILWLEVSPASPEGWLVRAARISGEGDVDAGPTTVHEFEDPARLAGAVHGMGGLEADVLVRSPVVWRTFRVSVGSGLQAEGIERKDVPGIPVGRSIRVVSLPSDPVVVWSGERDGRPVLWAWHAGSRWLASARGEGPAFGVAATPHALTLARPTGSGGSIPIGSVALADGDLDGVPDAADPCPGVPEAPDRFRDWDGCPEPEIPQDDPSGAGWIWFPVPAGEEPEMCAALLAGEAHPDAVVQSLVNGVGQDLPGADIVVSSETMGTFAARTDGTLARLDGTGAETGSVASPAGVGDDDRVVSVVMSARGLLVAWRDAGVHRKKTWKAAWEHLPAGPPDDGAGRGARRLVATDDGTHLLVTRGGAAWVLGKGGWEREHVGLEDAWILDAMVDPASGALHLVGEADRPRVWTRLRVVERLTVPADLFTKSGKKVKAGMEDALGGRLEDIVEGRVRVRLESYTDTSGSGETNLAISLERALALRRWLVDRGADETHVDAIGWGENHLVAPGKSLKNRRVVLVVLSPGP